MADWKQALGVITNALNVISAAGSTPGVNMLPYVSTIAAAAGALNTALNLGVNITPYLVEIANTFSGGVPTEAKRIALNVKIAELEAKVDEALPPREEGEPE